MRRRGNNGGFWDHSSQKIYELTENFWEITGNLSKKNKILAKITVILLRKSNVGKNYCYFYC